MQCPARTAHLPAKAIPDLESNAVLSKELVGKYNIISHECRAKHQQNFKLLSNLIHLHSKQRELEYKRLINCQQIAELKLREKVVQEECNDKVSELAYLLYDKEQFINAYQNLIERHKMLVLKYASDPVVENLFKKDSSMSDKSGEQISSVIQENDKLSEEIAKESEESSFLRSKLNSLREEQSDMSAFPIIEKNKLLECCLQSKSVKRQLANTISNALQCMN